ncbi:MAG: cadmium-translocating P-type ATPase, partial [Clostridia bacterium]|nr:cadmium-translocating P-type ATPase [Clostridia bacterium]
MSVNPKECEIYILKDLDCSSCAAKIERAVHEKGIPEARINFLTKSISIPADQEKKVREIIDVVEPGVELVAAHEAADTKLELSEMKIQIAVLAIAISLFILGMAADFQVVWLEYAVFLSAYFLVGHGVLMKAGQNILRGFVFDENFLMTISTVGAILIRQLPEAVGVMLFFYIGEFFQDLAVNRSRRSIKELMDIRPDYANLQRGEETKVVSPEIVAVGDIIVVRPGEMIPLDGTVIKGSSFINTAALTGESVPRKGELDDEVLAGTVNMTGVLDIKVTKPFQESSVSKILDLVENAGSRKAPTEQFITKFSRYYTPVVVFLALMLAFVPPLVIPGAMFQDWIYRALILLVISCPCALVVSIPLGYFGGIGAASRNGILVKGANFLEALTNLKTVIFDKTGTLTEGIFEVSQVEGYNGFSQEEVLHFAALAEHHSNHPIAKSITNKYLQWGHENVPGDLIMDYQEISGHGVRAVVGDRIVLAGNSRLLDREGIEHQLYGGSGTVVYTAVDGIFAGYISISDEIKGDSLAAVEGLKKAGVEKIVMLTGDNKTTAEDVAQKLGIDQYHANLLPEDKVEKTEELMESLGGHLAFVGDGINDAPVIMRADVGVAMGGVGSDAA